MWKRILQRRAVRYSAHAGLKASAVAPNSGITVLDNSQGASAAATELAASLNFAIGRLNVDDVPGDTLQLELDRLVLEASKYSNAKVRDDPGDKWTCNDYDARRLYAACLCSIMVYDSGTTTPLKDIDLREVNHFGPSTLGSRKAMGLWTLSHPASDGSLRELIVSVRGTSAALDHLVNLNGDQRIANSLFDFADSPETIHYAHAGFLNAATSILPDVTKEILCQLKKHPTISHITFTGHSAGGAVSSLLFLHFVSNTPTELLPVKFSLISFGAAPVADGLVTKLAAARRNVDIMLAIVNEGDLVSRTDRPYIRSVVDLYRSKFDLPPLGTVPLAEQDSGCRDILLSSNAETGKIWNLPAPMHHLVGQILLLSFDEDNLADVQRPSEPSLMGVMIQPEEFSKLLFCDVEVHRRRSYIRRLEMVRDGACRAVNN